MGQKPCEKPQTKSGASPIYITIDPKLLMTYLGHITKETFGAIVQAVSAAFHVRISLRHLCARLPF